MTKKRTATRTRIKPKALKMKFPKIDLGELKVQRDPENYNGQTRKMKFNDCNGRPKPKSFRHYIASNVELRTHKGILFGRAFYFDDLRRARIYSTIWLPVALNRAHENELQKRKKIFLSFIEDESVLFDEFYERIKKERNDERSKIT